MKILIFFFSIIIFASCRSTKKIHKAITNSDKIEEPIVPEQKKDTMAFAKAIIDSIELKKINFKTISAKLKVDAENGKDKIPDLVVDLKMIKDSIVWMKISGTILMINKEAFRMLVTKDSVFIIDKLEDRVTKRSIDYLQEITNMPLSLNTLQDLLIGNPIFLSKTILEFKNFDEKYTILSQTTNIKNLITVNNKNYNLLFLKLDDLNPLKSRTANITYSNYNLIANKNFSTNREIVISEKNTLSLKLNFKKIEFDIPITYSFKISSNLTPN